MNWKRIGFVLLSTISVCSVALANNLDSDRGLSSTVPVRSGTVQGDSVGIRVFSAPADLAAEASGNGGAIEIQAFAADFLDENRKAQYLLKHVSDFDRHRADVELANFPMENALPVRITGLKVGDYYVGVRVPARGMQDGSNAIEDLAWDGAQYECYQTNGYASAMYIVRWYRTKVKPHKTSLVVALFSPRSGDRNAKLSESAIAESDYGVPPNVRGKDDMYGVSRSQWLEVLSRTGKLFFAETNVPDRPLEKLRMETVLYLPDSESAQVKLLGRSLDVECEPYRQAPTEFPMSSSKEPQNKKGFQTFVKNGASKRENVQIYVRTYGEDREKHFVHANDANDVKTYSIVLDEEIVVDSSVEKPSATSQEGQENISLFPTFESTLEGKNEVRITNPNDFEKPRGNVLTITARITNVQEALKHADKDAYLQLVSLPPDGRLSGKLDDQGRMILDSELPTMPIPPDGRLRLRCVNLAPGQYVVAVQRCVVPVPPPFGSGKGIDNIVQKAGSTSEIAAVNIPDEEPPSGVVDLGEVIIYSR